MNGEGGNGLERILLVEDDPRIGSLLKRGLETEGYAVKVAADGDEGLEEGRTGEFELLILDLMLPKKSGLEICRELRRSKLSVPVLMLTAMDALEDKIKGFGAGADDYLTKPFALEELLARVKALLRRRGEYRDTDMLRVGDLVLDRKSHEVNRDGVPIELTAKEFALLEYLMRNPNQVLSRYLILERIWEYSLEVNTNVVDVTIRRLRQKIDEGREHPLIHTIRGTGYKIKE